jgi:hypothetical protein
MRVSERIVGSQVWRSSSVCDGCGLIALARLLNFGPVVDVELVRLKACHRLKFPCLSDRLPIDVDPRVD